MFDPVLIISIIFGYIAFLFGVGFLVEKNHTLRVFVERNPLGYALSLLVYLTSWTYYGCVGIAADSGLLYTTFYLGPMIAFPLWYVVTRKLVRIKNEYHITSIADFLSARYEKSSAIAVLVTCIAFLGTIPYVALQLRAIVRSFIFLTTSGSYVEHEMGEPWYVAPSIAIVMIIFTIVLGVRRIDPTERHPGIVATLSIQALVKLVSLLAVGIFVVYGMFHGFQDIYEKLHQSSLRDYSNFIAPGKITIDVWITHLILSVSAFMFLPRQFHVGVVENTAEKHMQHAFYIVPLFMWLMSIFIFPIAMAGLLQGYLPQEADMFILQLPLQAGSRILPIIVFMGGLAAATGMLVVTTMTMSTMLTNHIFLPIMNALPGFAVIKRHVLLLRWLAVVLFISLAYWFERRIETSYLLVDIGLLSFVAILQLAPAMLGGLFWQRGSRWGALLGLGAGFSVWVYTILVPAFVRSGFLSRTLLSYGPWNMWFLKPERLCGIIIPDPLTHAVFWSLLVNISFYVMGSLLTRKAELLHEGPIEISSMLGQSVSLEQHYVHYDETIPLSEKVNRLKQVFLRYYSSAESDAMIERCLRNAGIGHTAVISIVQLSRLCDVAERILAGAIGAAQAHREMKHSGIFSRNESKELSRVYAAILAELNINPDEMRRRIDHYQEREIILLNQSATLEAVVKKRTEQLESAHQELIRKEKLATLGNLLATVSHELRNPLGTIRSSLYSLTKRTKGKMEGVDAIIDRAERSVERCDAIIDELLDYTKAKVLRKEEYVFDEWLCACLDEIPIPDDIHCTITLNAGVRLSFDRERVRRCLLNVITNACQSMKPGGNTPDSLGAKKNQLRIETEVVSSHRLEVHIIDNGPGIAPEQMQRLFEPLYSTKSYGVGLGLAIVKQIMEMHQGGIDISSVVGKETKVVLWFPLDKAKG